MFDVSVIVCTYNPDYEKLFKTVKSILYQKYINFEIIIADDGSQDNYFNKIENLFDEINYLDYQLIGDGNNRGTVKNIYNAIKKANGKYIKLISPGDYLYKEDILSRWIKFMNEQKAKISFGNAVYYSDINGKYEIIQRPNAPRFLMIYHNHYIYKKMIKYHYILCQDLILGASTLMDKHIGIKYLREIIGKVRYAEDNIYSLMVVDGIKIFHYPDVVIWYEYGTGISTNKEESWKKIIRSEYRTTIGIVYKRIKNNPSYFDKKLKRYIYIFRMESSINKKRILKHLLFPSLVIWKGIRTIAETKTQQYADWTFFKKL